MRLEEEIRQSKFESPYQKVTVNVLYTANWIQHKSAGAFKASGLTSQQYNVLRILRGKHPNCCSVGYIKEVMLDKTPDVTRLLDRLEIKGLVCRSYNDKNRRFMDVTITEDGIQLLDAVRPTMRKNEEEFRHRLTEAEAEQLSALLDKLRG